MICKLVKCTICICIAIDRSDKLKSGFGIVGDIIVGILGAIIGGFIAGLLGLGASGFVGSIIIAFLGACLLIALLRAFSGGYTRRRTL